MIYFREGIHFLPRQLANSRSDLLGNCKRIVVKIGSKVLVSTDGKPDLNVLRDLCGQISDLHDKGLEVIVVTSGAILCGKSKLSLNSGGKSLQMQQASAAVGQALLMEHYNEFFGKRGKCIAQVLLTEDDFKDKMRHANLCNTFECLLKLKAIPIVNENDAVSTSELDVSEGKDDRLFGDNDVLSSLVAKGTNADALVILSTVEGLLDNNNKVISDVASFDDGLVRLDNGIVAGRGGLPTKLKAFKIASEFGIIGILANGRTPDVLNRIFERQDIGTFFGINTPLNSDIIEKDLASEAGEAQKMLAKSSTQEKNLALRAMAAMVRENAKAILEANGEDVNEARKQSLGNAFIERLELSYEKVEAMAETLEKVAGMAHPKEAIAGWTIPNGLRIRKIRAPLGVILVIFESRPDVIVEAAALALKSGNAIILKGGKEAKRTNSLLAEVLRNGISGANIPKNCIQLFAGTRIGLTELLQNSRIDLVVPRGGKDLLEFVRQNSKAPVIYAGGGVCHAYIHADADLEMASNIVVNAKIQKPSACNAIETLLVNERIAAKFLPDIAEKLISKGVELRCCEIANHYLKGLNVKMATEKDWGQEFSDLTLAIKVVPAMEKAIEHINKFGTMHSEAIITKCRDAFGVFSAEVDAAAVYWNSSTRFTDGGQFGFGAELCISTQKLHARGPVSLNDLFTYKYVIEGNGQVRD